MKMLAASKMMIFQDFNKRTDSINDVDQFGGQTNCIMIVLRFRGLQQQRRHIGGRVTLSLGFSSFCVFACVRYARA